ncbi:MAG: EamA family transporter RarD [Pseudomonadota bacterium]
MTPARPAAIGAPAPRTLVLETRRGLIAAVAAYTMWGLFPLFFRLFDGASAFEVLAHRIAWSLPVAALVLSVRKQWRETLTAFMTPAVVGMLAASAAVISFNWLVYVWSVFNDRVMEASLGYYINPLMYVAAGVLFLGERLTRLKAASVALASLGVLILSVGGGVFPWVSLALAVSFTGYGFLRKTVKTGAVPGLFVEIVFLTPFALGYLWWLGATGAAHFPDAGLAQQTFFALAGPVTVLPLTLFALAARRLTLTTLGFIQYIGPTLQFFCGLAFGEPFTVHHAICFGLIWTALALFSFDAARRSPTS